MTEKNVKVYVASDGTEFNSRRECEAHDAFGWIVRELKAERVEYDPNDLMYTIILDRGCEGDIYTYKWVPTEETKKLFDENMCNLLKGDWYYSTASERANDIVVGQSYYIFISDSGTAIITVTNLDCLLEKVKDSFMYPFRERKYLHRIIEEITYEIESPNSSMSDEELNLIDLNPYEKGRRITRNGVTEVR